MTNAVLDLKEYKFPKESFIGGWYMPEYICDGVIQYFYDNENEIRKGFIGDSSKENGEAIDETIKDSYDLITSPNNGNSYMNAYENHLGSCLHSYIKRYEFINKNYFFRLNNDYNIQHYKKGGGFKEWHFERANPNILSTSRVLVFMTYLNDVDDGGTEFYYQGIKTKAKKGLTLLWPTDFTHTHRGIISNTKEKYIVTGWYTYDEI